MIPRFRTAVLIACMLGAISCSSGRDPNEPPPMPRSQYKGEVGTSPVGAIPDVTLHDNDRNKDVRITIEYATRTKDNPLIVFSPGYGGTNHSYVGLSAYWASEGYVVIRVAHADAGRRPRLGEDVWEDQSESDRRNRVRDVELVLDSIDLLETRYPELKGKIDRQKIAVAGHSYGAYTAMLIAGVKTYPGGVSHPDPRVKAIVAMSPQGPSEIRGLTRDSWSDLHLPTLFMTGTRDRGISESETPEWRTEPFDLSPPGDKWLAIVEGASHGTFTGRFDALTQRQARRNEPVPTDQYGRPLTTQLPPERSLGYEERGIFGRIKSISVAFFDAYLRGDAKGREGLEKANGSGATVKNK